MAGKIVNLTPHEVNIEGKVISSDGTVRITMQGGLLGVLEGVKVVVEKPTAIEINTDVDLQEKYVIVSSVVAGNSEAIRELEKRGVLGVLVPTDFKRDERGRIIGAGALRLIWGKIPCPYCGELIGEEALHFENGGVDFECPNCKTQFPAGC